LTLKDRTLHCDECGLVINRDHNATRNILEAGHRLTLSQLEEEPTDAGHPAYMAATHLV